MELLVCIIWPCPIPLVRSRRTSSPTGQLGINNTPAHATRVKWSRPTRVRVRAYKEEVGTRPRAAATTSNVYINSDRTTRRSPRSRPAATWNSGGGDPSPTLTRHTTNSADNQDSVIIDIDSESNPPTTPEPGHHAVRLTDSKNTPIPHRVRSAIKLYQSKAEHVLGTDTEQQQCGREQCPDKVFCH